MDQKEEVDEKGFVLCLHLFSVCSTHQSPQLFTNVEEDWSDKMKRYLMIEDIGAGSFGFVYKMKDQKTGKVVAVKKVKPASLKHLGLNIRELVRKIKIGTNVLKQCDHKNIIKLLDEYQKGQKELYFVMDFCEGGSLRDYVFEEGSLPEPTARKLAVQIKDALLYMKSKEVSHRDLKPEHVLLTEQTEVAVVKLTGFGESQFKKLDSNGVTVYKTATTSGLYAAPELLAKGGVATADTFRSNGTILGIPFISLCVSLFEPDSLKYVRGYSMLTLIHFLSGFMGSRCNVI